MLQQHCTVSLFRLADLHSSVEEVRGGVRFAAEHLPIVGKIGKKADIYQLVSA